MTRNISAFFALSLCAGLIPGAALAQAEPAIVAGAHLRSNHGHFVCNVAINAAGAIATPLSEARYINAALTFQFGAGQGQYQVAFLNPCENVQITKGWYRIVQVDSLDASFPPKNYCTVQDAPGIPSAIRVRCFDFNGALANTPFTLSVSR